jgi:hypothetical protein
VLSAAIFVAVFIALLIGRVVFATIVFLWVLPEGGSCPICDAPTLRITSPFWNFFLPRFRTSWCPECGWEGLLRAGGSYPASGTGVHSAAGPRPAGRRVARRAR